MALLCATVAGCGGVQDAPSLPVWSIEPEPVTSIGVVEGDSAYLFQDIVGASLLSDGRIMVADGGLSVVRVFDPTGGFLTQMGGAGDGPGEFTWLRDARVGSGDTLVVWDSGAVRLSRFTPAGSLIGTVAIDASATSDAVGGLDALAGLLPDGSVVLTRLAVGERSVGWGVPDRLTLERYGPEGRFLGRAAERTGLVRVATSAGSGPMPFTPFPYFAAAAGELLATDGAPSVVSVLDMSLVEIRRIELPSVVHDVDAAWRALAARLAEPNAPPMAEWLNDMMGEMNRSDSIPHIAGLLVDEGGHMWTKQYDPATDALWLRSGGRVRGGRWWVVDVATGSLVAQVRVPERLAPMQVQGNRLLGVSIDDLGVQRVVLHEIRRPTGEEVR